MVSVVTFAYLVLVIGVILVLIAGALNIFGAGDSWFCLFALRAGALCIIFFGLSVAIAILYVYTGGLIK